MVVQTDIPRRVYGENGPELSVIGFGGIVVMNAEPATASRVVGEAVERGINYFDVAPAYGDAEIKLGPALEPYRKDVFLACKTAERSREKAEADFARSCERLRTDYFDLYQLHALIDVEKDVDAVFAPGGVMEMLIEKKESGQIRNLGFSVHSVEGAAAALERYPFDSVLFPYNFCAHYQGDFGEQIMEMARERGAARLALKAMARQLWEEDASNRETYGKCWYEPLSDHEQISMALRWTLSRPVTAALPPGEESLFRIAMDVASGPLEISEGETEQLKAIAKELNPIFRVEA